MIDTTYRLQPHLWPYATRLHSGPATSASGRRRSRRWLSVGRARS